LDKLRRLRMAKDKLKPCPFCGEKILLEENTRGYFPACKNSKCIFYFGPDKRYAFEKDAIKAANRRAKDAKRPV
jgi:Leu/Phe-tRNA-protein transferase